jgi:hypothetical protein
MLCQCRNPLTVPTMASTQDVVSICTAISRPVQKSARVAIFAMLAGYLRRMSLARIALASIGGYNLRQLPSKESLGLLQSRNA